MVEDRLPFVFDDNYLKLIGMQYSYKVLQLILKLNIFFSFIFSVILDLMQTIKFINVRILDMTVVLK